MKTLTEFSTLTLRKAAAARAAVGGAPRPVAAAPEEARAEEPAAEAAPATEGDAPSEAAAEAPAETPAAEAAPDPAIDAVAAACNVQPDRAARLLEALDIIGNSIDSVRLVRVYQGETGPHGAVSRGEFHYVVDRVAGAQRGRREERGERRGGGERGGRGGGERRGGGGGGPGGGGFGGPPRDKPRGLGSLKIGAAKEEPKEDDRPGRGEMPRAGIGWQLTAAPRDFGRGEGRGGGRGGPRRGPRPGGGPGGEGRGPRGPRPEGRGPGGGGGEFRGGRGPRGPRPQQLDASGQPIVGEQRPPREPRPPRPPREDQGPRLGPDGLPLPPRPRRERKPIGPDANGMGPDGMPWDPERRAKRQAERDAARRTEGGEGHVNTAQGSPVEGAPPSSEASKD